MIELSFLDHGQTFTRTWQAVLQQFEAEARESVHLQVLPSGFEEGYFQSRIA